MQPARPIVLVVDDDTAIRGLLQDTLEARGYAVEGAADGVDALARLAAGGVDLLLLDRMLPRRTDWRSAGACAPSTTRATCRSSCSRRWPARR